VSKEGSPILSCGLTRKEGKDKKKMGVGEEDRISPIYSISAGERERSTCGLSVLASLRGAKKKAELKMEKKKKEKTKHPSTRLYNRRKKGSFWNAGFISPNEREKELAGEKKSGGSWKEKEVEYVTKKMGKKKPTSLRRGKKEGKKDNKRRREREKGQPLRAHPLRRKRKRGRPPDGSLRKTGGASHGGSTRGGEKKKRVGRTHIFPRTRRLLRSVLTASGVGWGKKKGRDEPP